MISMRRSSPSIKFELQERGFRYSHRLSISDTCARILNIRWISNKA
jgi:hypothetical protein